MRAVAILDKKAVLNNIQVLKKYSKNSLLSIALKANAYGHGIVEIAKIITNKIDYILVASIEEGILLRKNNIKDKIIILSGFFEKSQVFKIIKYNLIPVIHSFYHFEIFKNLEKKSFDEINEIWIKFNIGMNRLGFYINDVKKVKNILKEEKYQLKNIVIISHLATNKHFDLEYTKEHYKNYTILEKNFSRYKFSLSNSPDIFEPLKKVKNDIVRSGISFYGINLFENLKKLPLMQVMTLEATIIKIFTLNKDEKIGYDGTFIAKENIKVAILSIGYGDGYPQHMPNFTPVLINNKKAFVIGKISMDMMAVDITKIENVKILDKAILWNKYLKVTKIAKFANMSPYSLLTGISSRVLRKVI